MKRKCGARVVLMAVALGIAAAGATLAAQDNRRGPSRATPAQRPVHTFSIVARDPATGEMGVAVQSHWFSVGSIVTWAEAGVGAVATQSLVDPAYGPLGLELMRAGKSAPEALDELLKKDKSRAVRQVAMIDAASRAAVWSGERDIEAAGHCVGRLVPSTNRGPELFDSYGLRLWCWPLQIPLCESCVTLL